MKKNFIASFMAGALLFGTAGVFAGQYVATENPFHVQLNGENVDIEGYNIEGSTYFKLRDIAALFDCFDVDFFDNTIQLSKDGYVYDNSTAEKYAKYIGSYHIPLEDTRYWFGYDLDIIAIDGKTVTFDYQYQKPGRAVGFTAEPAVFIDEHTAVGKGTFAQFEGDSANVIYTLTFIDDTIRITAQFEDADSPGYDNTYNIYENLASKYDLD